MDKKQKLARNKKARRILGENAQQYNYKYFDLPEDNIGEAALCTAVINQAAVDLLRGFDAARWLEGDAKTEGFGISFDHACQIAEIDVERFKARVLTALLTEDFFPEWDRLSEAPIGALIRKKDDNEAQIEPGV